MSVLLVMWPGLASWKSLGTCTQKRRSQKLYHCGFYCKKHRHKRFGCRFYSRAAAFLAAFEPAGGQNHCRWEELLVPITVQVPSGAAADGQHHIIFTARSEAEEVQAVVTVLVESRGALSLTLGRTDLTVARGERLVLPFTLENTSNYSTALLGSGVPPAPGICRTASPAAPAWSRDKGTTVLL